MTDVLDLLKQRLAVLSNRLRRYRVSRLRRQQNQQFAVNQKQFYRDLESQEVTNRENNVEIQKCRKPKYDGRPGPAETTTRGTQQQAKKIPGQQAPKTTKSTICS
ncbi:hypothetical protein QE152_g11109 [Popillia japonica]|uniref:Uncharacterized protein n=1 Tax=Popillia japonica TaxID=7064 RepID=A0AAW1LT28_POPJA